MIDQADSNTVHTTSGMSPRRRLLVPVIAAVATVLVVFGLMAIATSRVGTQGSSPQGQADITTLTGEDLAFALGLEPETEAVVRDCDSVLVESTPGTAFCLEGVTADPLVLRLLSLQIRGYTRTETAVDYIQALLAYEALDPSSSEAIAQNRTAQELYAQLNAEQPNVQG